MKEIGWFTEGPEGRVIRITSNFECGNGKNIRETEPGHFRLEVDADKQTGYGSYFCFDIVNDGPAASVTVEVREDPKFGGPTQFGRVFPTTIWQKPGNESRYRPLRGQTPECVDGCVTLTVPAEANQRVRVAMTYVAPFSEVVADLDALAEERTGRCERFSAGDSVEGRTLAGLRAGKSGKPKEKASFEEQLQLWLYALAAKEVLGLEPSKVSFYYLQNNSRLTYDRKPETLDEARRRILEIVRAIRSGNFPADPEMMKCRW